MEQPTCMTVHIELMYTAGFSGGMGAGLYTVSGKDGKSEGRSEWRPCQGKMSIPHTG